MNDLISNAREKAKAILNATDAQIERGLELHRQCLVCDSFGFNPRPNTRAMAEARNRLIEEGATAQEVTAKLRDMESTELVFDPAAREEFTGVWRDAGVDCIVHVVGRGNNLPVTLEHLARFQHKCDMLSDTLVKAVTVKDIRRAHTEGKLCLVWELNSPLVASRMEDGREELRWLDIFHMLGVRVMHLTYNRRNLIGTGCTERSDGGLSEFGRDVIQRMNELGILVDVPHSSRQTVLDAAKVSEKPIAATHTCCRALYDHPRGRTDEEIKAIAEKGGLIGILTIPTFIGEKGTLADMLDQIDHVADLVGVDHVAIGTDAVYASPAPGVELRPMPKARPGNWWGNWRDVRVHEKGVSEENRTGSLAWTNWPFFTVGLVTRGYSDDDIEKILSGNLLRVFGEVWVSAAHA
ncbi:MAG: dipeptidase [Planctomycetes bacterium]|nr:dipeptidase [Planctomycetota bacterium]